VVIIGLLVALLVPAVNRARVAAKNAVTRATIATLTTGIESFRADQRIGGAYPPSASDATSGTNLTYSVTNPQDTPTSGSSGPVVVPQGPDKEISGANLLVWALAGADFLGCPGFKPISGRSDWASSTSRTYDSTNPSQSGLYALYPDGSRAGQPVYPRVAPFIDLGKVTTTQYNPKIQVGGTGRTGSYVIVPEQRAAQTLGLISGENQVAQGYLRRYPFFVDGFGQPVLYFRADPAGTVIADISPNVPSNAGPPDQQRGIYHFLDNGSLLASGANFLGVSGRGSPGAGQRVLQLRPVSATAPLHNLVYNFGAQNTVQLGTATLTTSAFAKYIRNKNVTSKLEPQNAQGFLLITAGEDGIYGTADDINNFEHNGGELLTPQ